ncbi:MAG: hypothetical protein ABW004_00705 [Aeromicrobium sp.]
MTSSLRAVARLLVLSALVVAPLTALPTTAQAAGSATVKGTITDLAGKPLRGVTVRAQIPDGVPQPTATATSATDGTYALQVPTDVAVQICGNLTGRIGACYGPGSYNVDAYPEYPWLGIGATVQPAAGTTQSGVSFSLGTPAHLRGVVEDTAGRPVAGVTVRASTDCARGCLVDETTALTDASGRYDLAFTSQVVSPDTYCLTVAGAIDDGYATVDRYAHVDDDGFVYGCTRQIAVQDALAEPTVVLTSDGTAPVRSVATPYYVGTPKVGHTLSARPGTWEPARPALTYAWFDGSRRIGAGTTYVVRPAELGHTITIKATATAPGRTATTTSWTKGARVVKGTFWINGRPTVSGTSKVGRTLTARPRSSEPGGRRTYRWLRNGKAIGGATSAKYEVTRADRGRKLSVRVYYTQAAYDTTSRTSARTATVR